MKTPTKQAIDFILRPDGGIGRRKGLKIPRCESAVPVRVRLRAPQPSSAKNDRIAPEKNTRRAGAKQLADYVMGLDKVAAVTKGTIHVCEH